MISIYIQCPSKCELSGYHSHETKILSSSTEGRGSSFNSGFKGRLLDLRPSVEDDKALIQNQSIHHSLHIYGRSKCK